MSSSRSPMPRRKKIIFLCGFLLLIGFSLELLLNLLCFVATPVANALQPPWHSLSEAGQTPMVEDDVLGHRPRPNFADHDERGFRNSATSNPTDILCLGDSQTYGRGVMREEAWPHQLAQASGQDVYNMAFDGWGPTHAEAMVEEVKSLGAKLVIEGFYAGNDLFDCYDMVYAKQQLAHHRSTDPAVKDAIQQANANVPLAAKIEEQFRIYCGKFAAKPAGITTRGVLSKHSRIFGLARAVKQQLGGKRKPTEFDKRRWDALRRTANLSDGKWEVLDTSAFHTIFVPEYRLAAIDTEDARIQEGLRISLNAITNMSQSFTSEDIQFVVVLIPTKLLVFAPTMPQSSKAFRELVEKEQKIWTSTKEFLNSRGIQSIDALPELRKAVEDRIQPYPASTDGHPNAAGHRAISAAVLRWLQTQRAIDD